MKIALVGNQNSGKTTLFNTLTGMHAKIGNWPGVTIEKKSGKIKGTNHEITDLPGIYSLSPYSIEEDISRKYVFDEKPDVIINILDSTQLERSLYLTTQLLELDTPIVVALNMADLLEKKGIKIDAQELSKKLGTPAIIISALKGDGIDQLMEEVEKKAVSKKIVLYDTLIEKAIDEIRKELPKKGIHKRFIAVKLLEDDPRFLEYQNKKIKVIRDKLSEQYELDLEEVIATERYESISNIKKDSIRGKRQKESLSDRLDKVFLNKWLAFPIFVVIMFFVYFLSVGLVGTYTVDLIGEWMEALGSVTGDWLTSLGVSAWNA